MTTISYTSYAEMSESDYQQWLTEFYKEHGPEPDVYDFQDFIEDSIDLI